MYIEEHPDWLVHIETSTIAAHAPASYFRMAHPLLLLSNCEERDVAGGDVLYYVMQHSCVCTTGGSRPYRVEATYIYFIQHTTNDSYVFE